MPIPSSGNLLLPMLEFVKNGKTRTLKETVRHLADVFKLSNKDLEELQPSGRQTKFEKRVGWARYYLGKAGYIRTVGYGSFVITKSGLDMLQNKKAKILVSEIEEIIKRN